MTTSTPRTRLPRGRRAGFTLVEVMISAAISGLILAGVLSAFLMIGRTGYLSSSYSELHAQTRNALDVFGEDVRRAADLRWNSDQSITLSLVTSGSGLSQVTYAYDGDQRSANHGSFYRKTGDAASSATPRVLLRGLAPDFTFRRYKLERAGQADNLAATDLETKQIEVVFRAQRKGATTATASQNAQSARYILRNKRVSN